MQLPAADRANRPKIQMHAKKILELHPPERESYPVPKKHGNFSRQHTADMTCHKGVPVREKTQDTASGLL